MIPQNLIKIKDIAAFRDSLKEGDKLIYWEDAPKDEGIKGRTKIKRVMEVEKVHRHTVDLKEGKVKRNVTLKELAIYNRKLLSKQSPQISPQESDQTRKNTIMNMIYHGMSREEIAQRTGYSRRTIGNTIRYTKDKKEKAAARNAQIVRLKQEGKRTKDIAKQLGCSKSLVCEVYKRYKEKNSELSIKNSEPVQDE